MGELRDLRGGGQRSRIRDLNVGGTRWTEGVADRLREGLSHFPRESTVPVS